MGLLGRSLNYVTIITYLGFPKIGGAFSGLAIIRSSIVRFLVWSGVPLYRETTI